MKRLILSGGKSWEAKDEGERFASVLFRYVGGDIKLAFCIFAQPESEWESTRAWNINMLNRFKGNRSINYQTLTPENFAEVSAWADIIYIPGGDPFQLTKKLQQCGNVAELWDGKVIMGSSAGADLLCEKFVYLQDKTFGDGLGWVKASFAPHWRAEFEDYTDADWDWVEQELLKRFPDLPVLCVPESDFVEFSAR